MNLGVTARIVTLSKCHHRRGRTAEDKEMVDLEQDVEAPVRRNYIRHVVRVA